MAGPDRHTPLVRAQQRRIDQIAQAVDDNEVYFLDARCPRRRYPDLDISVNKIVSYSATVAACQCDNVHATFVRSGNRTNYIF